jgi:Ca-activated chloride channel family protein
MLKKLPSKDIADAAKGSSRGFQTDIGSTGGQRLATTAIFVDGVRMNANAVRKNDMAEAETFREKKIHREEIATEDYGVVRENEFEKVTQKPLSTLSIDVDVASYSFIRNYLNQGMRPPKEAVRLEEMINYFSYDYPQPKDENPFSITGEISAAPWNTKHKLLHVGIQGKDIAKENLPPSNLVFLIDVSGSMHGPAKLGLVQQSLRLLVNELNERDKIALVVYAGASGLVLPSTPCNKKEEILKAIDNLQAGGGTAGAAGINLAYKVAQENFLQQGNNRIVLCTDGDFNIGVSSETDLVSLIEDKRKSGVFLSVLGYGMGNFKDHKMEQLADKGNGNYAYIDSENEANKVLVKEMGGTLLTIAKDVKIQIEFNPAKVKGYRLLGYENRLLADRDFNDDTKDAGEIGAGAGVTALYEIITDEAEMKSMGSVDSLKFQKPIEVATTGSDEWLTVKVRFKAPDGTVSKLTQVDVKDQGITLDKSSDNFRFCAAVASFGMLLKDSKFKGDFSMEKVIALAKNSLGKDNEGYRAAFIQLVKSANDKGLLSQK